MVKMKNFDIEKRFFKYKNDTIPIEKFLPETLTMVFVFFLVLSVSGVFYEFMQIVWYVSLPFAIVSGLFACFIVQHLMASAVNSLKGNRLPKGEAAAGLNGYCTAEIQADSWGRVKLIHKEHEFEVNAACAGEKDILNGEKVICVYESDGFYFVVRIDEIYKEL